LKTLKNEHQPKPEERSPHRAGRPNDGQEWKSKHTFSLGEGGKALERSSHLEKGGRKREKLKS
jgi:hypothetical protein